MGAMHLLNVMQGQVGENTKTRLQKAGSGELMYNGGHEHYPQLYCRSRSKATWADLGEEPKSNEGSELGGQANLWVGKGSSHQNRNMEREYKDDGSTIG